MNVGRKGQDLQSVLLLNTELLSLTLNQDTNGKDALESKTLEAIDTINKEYSDIVLLKKRRYRIKLRVIVSKMLAKDGRRQINVGFGQEQYQANKNRHGGNRRQNRRNRKKQK